MADTKKKVSVIIPAYNAESTIGEGLKALGEQTYARELYEIIVIDDGSTDQTSAISRSLCDRLLIQNNAGPAMARNYGVSQASGEIVLFTDADCVADKNFIEQMVQPFSNPLIVGVKGSYRTNQQEVWARFAQVEFEERYVKLAKAESIDFVDSHAAAFRIDVFREVGGFDPHFPVANNEDVDLSYKIARLGYKMAFNPSAVVFHYHPNSMMKYLRTKFLRAYWRMLVYRRFPEKIVTDTYTPQTLKLQILCTALLLLTASLTVVAPSAWKLLPIWLGGFLVATGPFLYTAFKLDPGIILFSIPAIFLRSIVFGFGVFSGFLAQRRRDLLIPTALITADFLTAILAYSGAFWIRSIFIAGFLRPFDHTFNLYLSIFPITMIMWLMAFHSQGLYKTNVISTGIEEYSKVTRAITISVFGMITLSFFGKWDFSRGFILIFWILSILMSNIIRHAIRSFQDKIRAKGLQVIRTVIVGSGETGKLVFKSLQDVPKLGIKVVGVVDDLAPDPKDPVWGELQYLGSLAELDTIVRNNSVDDVFIAKPDLPHQEILDMVVRSEKSGAGFKIVSDLASILTGGAGLSPVSGIPVIDLKEEKHDWGRKVVKRFMDLVLGLLLIIILLPLMSVLALIIHFGIGGSVLIKKERVGLNGRLFKMYRYRVYPPGYQDDSGLPPSIPGRIFRRTYLDELPQLLNVIRGEMSLVGPRPEVPEIVATYATWQRKRLEVPPGITGLWQVTTPGDQPLHKDLEYDFYYIKNYNIWMDLSLLLRTIPIVLFGKRKK